MIQRNKWQLYLDFQPTITTKSILFDYILNPFVIVNFGKENKRLYNLNTVKNYDFVASVDDNTHIIKYLYHTVLFPFLDKKYMFYFLPKHSFQCVEKLNLTKFTILLNPQGSLRELPAEELNKILLGIKPSLINNVDFLLTNTQNSLAYLAKLDPRLNIQLAEKMSVVEYLNLVNCVDLVIAVDGGGVHIACAYEKPLLAFYANCPKNISRWRPINRAETYLVIGNEPTDDNNATFNFPVAEAIDWLNIQLAKRIKKRKLIGKPKYEKVF